MAVEEFLGLGAATKKSVLLALLSVQPPFNLIIAVVFDGAVVAAVPSKQFPVPNPT